MRIAHVSPYDHGVAGGVREHVVNLARAHRRLGHDATVLAPCSRADKAGEGIVPVSTRVVPLPGAGSIARISLSPAAFRRVGRFVEGGGFDVVHVHEPLVPVVCLSALYHSRTTTVGTIHGYRPRYALYGLLRRPLARLMDRLSARVAVSADARRWVSRYFPGEYHVIPDGVDVERFADPGVRAIEAFDDGRPNVLFVGRMEPRKGFPHLLTAFERVRTAVPEARLIVAGAYSDQQRAHWTREASRRGLTGVAFVGYVSDEDLPRYYRSASVFCAPSTGYEALGIVLLEAMAAGLPVVTTNIEGSRTVVRDGLEARVVEPRDVDGLADALVTLLRDPARRREMAAHGRARAEEYAWPSIARRLLDLYASSGAEGVSRSGR